jgi:hypothetical protein
MISGGTVMRMQCLTRGLGDRREQVRREVMEDTAIDVLFNSPASYGMFGNECKPNVVAHVLCRTVIDEI